MTDALGADKHDDPTTLEDVEREHITKALAATNWVPRRPKGCRGQTRIGTHVTARQDAKAKHIASTGMKPIHITGDNALWPECGKGLVSVNGW